LSFIFVFLIIHPLKAQVIDTVFYQEGQVKAYGLITLQGAGGSLALFISGRYIKCIENYRNGELQPENGGITTKKAGWNIVAPGKKASAQVPGTAIPKGGKRNRLSVMIK
jgi:hypothetical protein